MWEVTIPINIKSINPDMVVDIDFDLLHQTN